MHKYFKWVGYNPITMVLTVGLGFPVFVVWFVSILKLMDWCFEVMFN